MSDRIFHLWVYLAESPLLHLTLTLIAYQIGQWIYLRTHRHPLANPVLFAVVVLVVILSVTHTSYATYFEGAQFVHFLLGPATVALAVPLYRSFDLVKRSALAVSVALVSGSLTAAGSAVGIAWMLGASPVTLLSLAPKSVSAPIAMGISQQLGGMPSLTAVLVISTGIAGGALGPVLLDKLKIGDPRARGLALGTASHGIGTARALQETEIAGAFSGLAMGLNGLATAILLPLLALLF